MKRVKKWAGMDEQTMSIVIPNETDVCIEHVVKSTGALYLLDYYAFSAMI